MAERRASEAEVLETVREAMWQMMEGGKCRARRWYAFNRAHEGTFYRGKDVEPVFVEEPDRIVVVTVYVYFNQREGP